MHYLARDTTVPLSCPQRGFRGRSPLVRGPEGEPFWSGGSGERSLRMVVQKSKPPGRRLGDDAPPIIMKQILYCEREFDVAYDPSDITIFKLLYIVKTFTMFTKIS